MNWKSIETAPKDGRPVLLFADAAKTGPVWAIAKWSSYAIKGVKHYGWVIAFDFESGAAVKAVGATHWMPPPSGPNEMTEH